MNCRKPRLHLKERVASNFTRIQTQVLDVFIIRKYYGRKECFRNRFLFSFLQIIQYLENVDFFILPLDLYFSPGLGQDQFPGLIVYGLADQDCIG